MTRLEEILKLATVRTLTQPENTELKKLLGEEYLTGNKQAGSMIGEHISRVVDPFDMEPALAASMNEAIVSSSEATSTNPNPLNPINPLNPSPLNPFNPRPRVHRIHFLKSAWFKYAAAIIIILGISAYLFTINSPRPDKGAQVVNNTPDVAAPASVLATITLSNGKQVNLDSLQNGILAQEGDVTIEKLNDGRIVYKGISEGKMLYNTISVPRGSKIASLALSDGTIVFLNTASSLKYPVAFTGKERRVQITGEAYFEVAKDRTKKFIVETDGMATEVLGTHFNVNGYSDETIKAVTLLEGSIKVNKNGKSLVVKPGEQALVKENNIQLNPTANISQVMAWKNGYFAFHNADIPTVMKQLSKWYDIEVVYENGIPDVLFSGELQRKLSLSQVIEVLNRMDVHCTIKGKQLIIRP